MRRDSAHLCYGPHSQAAHLAELQAQADEEAVALGGPPEELPDEEGPVPPPRVVANPKTSTMDDLYHDLEAVPFPDERIKDARELLGENSASEIQRIQGSLQVPFGLVFLALVSLASFSMHRTVAMYT
ncbi:unnamed protein product, partial [Prorocentrum cordatum]